MKKYFSLLLLFIALGVFYTWKHFGQSKFFENEATKNINGIITDKQLEQANNPKAYKIEINNSIWQPLDFNLIAEVEKGDTIIKKPGENVYTYYGKSKIVKHHFVEPQLLDVFYTKERGSIDIINR